MRACLLLSSLALLLLAGCGGGDAGAEGPRVMVSSRCGNCAISAVRLEKPYRSYPYVGDIWTMTWAADDRLYAMFGDGTGMKNCLPTLLQGEHDEFDDFYTEERPGCYRPKDAENEYCQVFSCSSCLPQCLYTPAGLAVLEGTPPEFADCKGPDQCIRARHVPYGNLAIYEHSDKPSSLVAIGRRLYAHMHFPPGQPTYGYLATSGDGGKNWTIAPDSPWKGDSHFRVMMFIQRGRAYQDGGDGYLYALAMDEEVAPDPRPNRIFLARVPLQRDDSHDPILDYRAWRYFSGMRDGKPVWKDGPDRARPLSGLTSLAQGSAMYHAESGRYLFLSGFVGMIRGSELGLGSEDPYPAGALFEAPEPWGPWRRVGLFPAGFIASLIPKGSGPDHVWFAAAGGGEVTYNLNFGKLVFRRERRRAAVRPAATGSAMPGFPAPFELVSTRKREQIIGDIDFETLERTRQRTESRFGLAHTDLGAPFEYRGKLWLLFGDSDPEAPGWDPRHDDAIGWTAATRVEDFRLYMLTDPKSGRGYLNPRISCPAEGLSDCVDLGTLNVPVAALGDEERGRIYAWFAVHAASASILARSSDDARSFEKLCDFGRTRFIDIAVEGLAETPPGLSGDGPWVLLFGSGDHDHDDVYLAAMTRAALRRGDCRAVRFVSAIAGNAENEPVLSWSPRETDAVPIFTIDHGAGLSEERRAMHAWGFGEPLVHYNRTLELWLATYNWQQKTIRLRIAAAPWGPWSDPLTLFDPRKDYGRGPAWGRYINDGTIEHQGPGEGELYGPYVLERYTRIRDNGDVVLRWLLSPWQPYTVLLMESVLRPTP